MRRVLQFITIFFLLIIASSLNAHVITPTIISLSQIDQKHYQLELDTNLEALMAGIGNNHKDTDNSPVAQQYKQLREMTEEQLYKQSLEYLQSFSSKLQFVDGNGNLLQANFELRTVNITANSDLKCARDTKIFYDMYTKKTIEKIAFRSSKDLGNIVLRVFQNQNIISTLWVQSGELSKTVVFNQRYKQRTLIDYIVIGFEHIVPLGLDHILFVIGLYLLSQRVSPLLWQVTAFTLAHTLTLALASLGIFSLPSSIVEPLIALSISYIAIENLFHHVVTKLRIFIIFLFGLLHGMGFAGVLSEIGLDPEAFILSLLSFNLGVELGQLAVILGMFVFFGIWLGKTKYWENYFRKPLSVSIALVGIFWFFQRIL